MSSKVSYKCRLFKIVTSVTKSPTVLFDLVVNPRLRRVLRISGRGIVLCIATLFQINGVSFFAKIIKYSLSEGHAKDIR